MKVLLVNPPLEGVDTKRCANFPLGLAYLARVIQEEGHEVEIADVFINGHSREEIEKIIQEGEYDIVGVTGIVSVLDYLVWISRSVKKYSPSTLILAGGALATSAPRIVLENTQVDIAVIGEGELVIRDILKVLKERKGFEKIEGIVYKNKNKEIVSQLPNQRIDNLDKISFPAWELFEVEKYVNTPAPLLDLKWNFGKRWINIVSSRGCPFHCVFCGKTFGAITRVRSAENILEEIKELIRRYQIEHINFCDDFFAADRNRLLKICDYIKNLDKKITWTASIRVDSVDETVLDSMKKAGCLGFCLGVESGSQKILDNLNKNTKVETAKRAVLLSKKYKFHVHAAMMFGMTGENKQTVQESAEFIKSTGVFPQPFNYVTPLPGSKLYEDTKQRGLIKNEFEYLRTLKGSFFESLKVNLTEMETEELIKLKKQTEAELRRFYLKRHPFWGIKRFVVHLIYYGPSKAFQKLKESLQVFQKHNYENIKKV